jgi:lysyl-tRNA synthetase class 2
MSDESKPTPPPEDIQIPLADLVRIRRDKARALTATGLNPYPYRYDSVRYVKDLLADFDRLATDTTMVRIAGRIMSNRKMGKVFFADLRDSTERLQIYVRRDDVGEDSFKLFDQVDLGDIIGCEGTLFVTKTGERTLRVGSFELLTKSLHPLPDKHSGLTDKETRYRRRYADLIANPEVRETFRKRTKIIQIVRDFLNGDGFLEVETPILQPLYGGASARPFKTRCICASPTNCI